MARVRCVMMQRNDHLLLDAWFRYYGYLFGFENLDVFDNGSTDEGVIETLKTYERTGARVYWQYGRLEDFHAKGFHFTNIIQNWEASENYDFAIPIDCDEFLAVFTDSGLSCQKDQIHSYLDSLKGERRALGVEHSLYNVPGKRGYYCASPYPKGFFSAGTIGTLDHGFHEPVRG